MLFGPEKGIIVVGVNKIVENLDEALERIRKKAALLNVKRHPSFDPMLPCWVRASHPPIPSGDAEARPSEEPAARKPHAGACPERGRRNLCRGYRATGSPTMVAETGSTLRTTLAQRQTGEMKWFW
jgi:hypothetical protein